MAVTINELFNGSASISTTEYSLTNNSTTLTAQASSAALQIMLDLNALAAGDQYDLKIYEKCRSGGTQRMVDTWTLTGAQSGPIFVTPTIQVKYGWEVTLKKITGTDRTIEWSLRSP